MKQKASWKYLSLETYVNQLKFCIFQRMHMKKWGRVGGSKG